MLEQYFLLVTRYRKAGAANPLVQKVVMNELKELYATVGSPRLKLALNKFFCENGESSTDAKSPAL